MVDNIEPNPCIERCLLDFLRKAEHNIDWRLLSRWGLWLFNLKQLLLFLKPIYPLLICYKERIVNIIYLLHSNLRFDFKEQSMPEFVVTRELVVGLDVVLKLLLHLEQVFLLEQVQVRFWFILDLAYLEKLVFCGQVLLFAVKSEVA